MISMSKMDIINYLRDYAYLQERFVIRGEKSLPESFKYYMIATKQYDKLNTDYLNAMLRIYNLYLNFKIYSVTEDYYLNRDDNVNNEDLNNFVHKCKFIEKPSNMTNKRLLEVIRNTFNHGLGDNFKISKNGKNILLDIDDIRLPKQQAKGGNKEPLKMRFNLDYLNDVYALLTEKGRNVLFTYYDIPNDFNINSNDLYHELDKIKLKHYYFDKKLEETVSDRFKKLNKLNLKNNLQKIIVSNKLHKLASSINPSKKFDLTDDQKKKVISLIKKYKESYPDMFKGYTENFMYFVLNDVVPIPGLKLSMFKEQLYYLAILTDGNNLTFNQASIVVDNSINKNEKYETIKDMNEQENLNLFRHMVNGDFTQAVPYIIYIDSVISHLCEEDSINIDGIDYDRNRLRNAFAHCRWYIGDNSKLHLFDANPRNKFDLDLLEVGTIDLMSFVKWADQYVFKKQKEENKKLTYK